MSKTHWAVLVTVVGVAAVALVLGLVGFWILSGTSGGMMAPGTSWRGVMGRLCPWCGGTNGLLGSPRTLLLLGLFMLLPVGLLLLLIMGLVWLVHHTSRPAKPRPPA